jgi:hypothetical protein
MCPCKIVKKHCFVIFGEGGREGGVWLGINISILVMK